MKKRWLKMAAALCVAAVFAAMAGGCGAGAEGTAAVVSETGFEPPEEIITANEQGEPQTWTYQHMTTTPARGFSVDIGGADVEEVS